MTLCRIATRCNFQAYIRTSSYLLNQVSTVNSLIARPQNVTFNTKRTYTLQSLNFYGYERNGKHSNVLKWGAAAFIGACGASLALKYLMEEAECNEAQNVKTDDIWKNCKITLYQYQTCPFCTKARTFLTYHQIPFEIVEVHPIFKKEIKFSKKYKKVPIVTVETEKGMQEVQDSSLIISVLSTYMSNHGKRDFEDIMNDYPATEIIDEDGKKRLLIMNKYWVLEEEPDKADEALDDPRQSEAQWRQWADDHLVHLISPNVYRTYQEAYQAFAHHVRLGKFNGTWEGVVAKVFGSLAMWIISKKLKKKYCKNDDVRIDIYRACNEWLDALGKKKFMGGDEPNLADLSVYGVLNVMDGLVSFEDVTMYTRIKPWYMRVQRAVESKKIESSTRNQTSDSIVSTVPSDLPT